MKKFIATKLTIIGTACLAVAVIWTALAWPDLSGRPAGAGAQTDTLRKDLIALSALSPEARSALIARAAAAAQPPPAAAPPPPVIIIRRIYIIQGSAPAPAAAPAQVQQGANVQVQAASAPPPRASAPAPVAAAAPVTTTRAS